MLMMILAIYSLILIFNPSIYPYNYDPWSYPLFPIIISTSIPTTMTIPTDPNASWEGTLPPESYPKYSLIKYGWESNIVNHIDLVGCFFPHLDYFCHILGMPSQLTIRHIFRRGCSTTNQLNPQKSWSQRLSRTGQARTRKDSGYFTTASDMNVGILKAWENRWESRLENDDFSHKSWELISNSSDLTGQGHCFGHGGTVFFA